MGFFASIAATIEGIPTLFAIALGILIMLTVFGLGIKVWMKMVDAIVSRAFGPVGREVKHK